MHVFYDHQVFSLQNAGGGSRYFYELVRYLSGISGIRTDVLLGSNETVHDFRALASRQVRVRSFGNTLHPGARRYFVNELLGSCLSPFLGKVDVYHPTHHRIMPAVRARRIVVTHHDCTQERFPHVFRYLKRVLAAKKLLYERADSIICVSESSRKDLLHYYAVDEAKTTVVHHGLSPLPRSQAAAAELRQAVRRPYVLYVGSRAEYKNFTGLLQAFHEAKLSADFDLLAVGGGVLTTAEKAMIAGLGLTQSIVCLPRVSDEFLGECYAGARLFVYPSLWEGFGIPPLEAMAVGCPVVAANTGSIPEVCRDAPLYFDPYEPNSLVCTLLQAMNDETGRHRAIKRGKEVAAYYTWKGCGDRTLALYRQCQ